MESKTRWTIEVVRASKKIGQRAIRLHDAILFFEVAGKRSFKTRSEIERRGLYFLYCLNGSQHGIRPYYRFNPRSINKPTTRSTPGNILSCQPWVLGSCEIATTATESNRSKTGEIGPLSRSRGNLSSGTMLEGVEARVRASSKVRGNW